MSESVDVPFGDNAGETATLLLAAAEDLGLDASVVQVSSETSQAFNVPEEVKEKAGIKDESEDPKPAKKTAAKKAEK